MADDKHIKNISAVSTNVAKRAKKDLELVERYGSASADRSTVSAVDRALNRLAKTTGQLADGIKTISVETARGVKDVTAGGVSAVNEYAKAVGEDINVDREAFTVQALGKITPLVGYSMAKMMETAVFKNMIEKMKGGLNKALSSVTDRFRKLASMGWDKGKEFVNSIMDRFSSKRGAVKIKMAKARAAKEEYRQKGIVSKAKKNKKYVTKEEAINAALSDAKIAADVKKKIRTAKVEDNVPHMAKGGYVEKEGIAKVHAAEVVQPVEKVVEQIVEQVNKRLDSMTVKTKNAKEKAKEMKEMFKGTILDTSNQGMERTGMGRFADNVLDAMQLFTRKSLNLEQRIMKQGKEDRKGITGSFLRALRTESQQEEIPLMERQVRATLELKNTIAGQTDVWRAAFDKMLYEHPVFHGFLIAGKFTGKLISFLDPISTLFKGRGGTGYESDLPSITKGTVFEQLVGVTRTTYIKQMEKLDQIIHNTGAIALNTGSKKGDIFEAQKAKKKWSIAGSFIKFTGSMIEGAIEKFASHSFKNSDKWYSRLYRFSKRDMKESLPDLAKVKGKQLLSKGKDTLRLGWDKARDKIDEARYGDAAEGAKMIRREKAARKTLKKHKWKTGKDWNEDDVFKLSQFMESMKKERARSDENKKLKKERDKAKTKNRKKAQNIMFSRLKKMDSTQQKQYKTQVKSLRISQRVLLWQKKAVKKLGLSIWKVMGAIWTFVSGIFKGGIGGIGNMILKGMGIGGGIAGLKKMLGFGGKSAPKTPKATKPSKPGILSKAKDAIKNKGAGLYDATKSKAGTVLEASKKKMGTAYDVARKKITSVAGVAKEVTEKFTKGGFKKAAVKVGVRAGARGAAVGAGGAAGGPFAPITAAATYLAFAAYDSYAGVRDAANILGKPKEQLTLMDKFKSSSANVVSGLTLGIVSPKSILKGIGAIDSDVKKHNKSQEAVAKKIDNIKGPKLMASHGPGAEKLKAKKSYEHLSETSVARINMIQDKIAAYGPILSGFTGSQSIIMAAATISVASKRNPEAMAQAIEDISKFSHDEWAAAGQDPRILAGAKWFSENKSKIKEKYRKQKTSIDSMVGEARAKGFDLWSNKKGIAAAAQTQAENKLIEAKEKSKKWWQFGKVKARDLKINAPGALRTAAQNAEVEMLKAQQTMMAKLEKMDVNSKSKTLREKASEFRDTVFKTAGGYYSQMKEKMFDGIDRMRKTAASTYAKIGDIYTLMRYDIEHRIAERSEGPLPWETPVPNANTPTVVAHSGALIKATKGEPTIPVKMKDGEYLAVLNGEQSTVMDSGSLRSTMSKELIARNNALGKIQDAESTAALIKGISENVGGAVKASAFQNASSVVASIDNSTKVISTQNGQQQMYNPYSRPLDDSVSNLLSGARIS